MKCEVIKRLTDKKNVIEDYTYSIPSNKKDQRAYYEHELREIDTEIEWLKKMVCYEPHEAKEIAYLVSKIKSRHPEDIYVQKLFKEIQTEEE